MQLFNQVPVFAKIPDEDWKSFIPFLRNSWKDITPEAL